jgi:nucleotide-binding universal stress UspA family protein
MAAPADKVVIAVDGSGQSSEAFDWYVEHLHKPGNLVVLVHAMEIPSLPSRDTWDAETRAGKAKRQELQDKYTAMFKEKEIAGKFISDFEKPGEFLVDTAKKEEATYIVMGTRGLGKIRRTIMGSVSDYVVHHATCPVLVCRK